MKLELDEELKVKLSQMREILAGVLDPNIKPIGEDPTTPPGCGHYCMITCSWHCEDTCADSCSGTGSRECHYKLTDPCGYYMKSFG